MHSVGEQAWHRTAGGGRSGGQGLGTGYPGVVGHLAWTWGLQGDGCHPKKVAEQSMVVERHVHQPGGDVPLTTNLGLVSCQLQDLGRQGLNDRCEEDWCRRANAPGVAAFQQEVFHVAHGEGQLSSGGAGAVAS